MSLQHDITFRSMGSDIRLLIGAPIGRDTPPAAEAALAGRAFLEDFAARLSRFAPDSELSVLNRDARRQVPASPLLINLVSAGIGAAARTGGLVDPTLVGQLEEVGYDRSLGHRERASLRQALANASPRRAARPHPAGLWRSIHVDPTAGLISRPPGLRIDSGGVGKGLAADLVARSLMHYSRFVVDCGGDLAIGGVEALVRPYEIGVEHPLTGETVRTLRLSSGGVATSGLNVRLWRNPDGGFHHHLLDPASGRPAWSGLIGATAIGDSALDAEVLAKAALLLGPAGARRVLAERGGVIVHDDGDVELVGPVDEPPRMRLQIARSVV